MTKDLCEFRFIASAYGMTVLLQCVRWQLHSYQRYYMVIAGYGIGLGHHRVGPMMKGSWANKIVI